MSTNGDVCIIPKTYESNSENLTKSPNWVPILDQPFGTPMKIRVVCIGSGYSGLTLAYKCKHEYCLEDLIDLTIYEKNYDVGGTWLENKYPGVACDVPAHIYTFPFEPNPDWSSFYASGLEIWNYIKRTTLKYRLDENVRFNCRVESTVWDDDLAKWQITIRNGDNIIKDEADILVNGAGYLNKWSWPAIDGFNSFTGKLLHSAAWDPDLDWTNKRIAVIGNGSSAVQIIPQIQPKAKSLTPYIRSPSWVSPNFAFEFTPEGKNFQYTLEEKRKFKEHPEELLNLRKQLEHKQNEFFHCLLKDSPQQAAAFELFKKQMQERLNNDPLLCEKLIPTWAAGCKRLSPGEGYLEALQKPNVSVQFGEILEITEKGIKTQESEREYDIIICATRFNTSFTPQWSMKGRNGVDLAKQWRDYPEAYFGLCAPHMPNYFIFNGPNSPVAHGSTLAVINWTSDYILRWCKKIALEHIKYIEIKQDAVDDYNTYEQELLKRTVWTDNCQSWFKNGKADGRVIAMYAGSVIHYKEMLESIRSEDFHIVSRSKNRFQFMGNGLTIRETSGGHLAFYLEK